MATDSLQLLKHLEPAVRPAYAPPDATRGGTPVEHQRFDELLEAARKGALQSGRMVTLGFRPPRQLGIEQMERLASAADLAEASGARRALIMIEGRGFLLDVPRRVVSGELSTGAASRIVAVDAAVFAAGDAPVAPLGPPGGVAHRAVGDQLDTARRP